MTNRHAIRIIALGLALAACGTGPVASTAPAVPTSQMAAITSPMSVATEVPTPEAMAPTPSVPSAAAAAPSLEEGTPVDVGGYSLWIRCTGEGSATVGTTPNLGEPVLEVVGELTRVCTYFPAGIELSDPPPGPRTAAALARDLHALLDKAGVPGPYVPVRGALGGLTGRAYADDYPDEVAGLVFLDSPHPAIILGSTDPSWADPSWNPEMVHYKRSAQEIPRIETLGDLPLVVISQGVPDLPAQLMTTPKRWQRGQVRIAGLSSDSMHVVATESGHNPHIDQPELVTEAIKQVVEAVRAGKSLPPCEEALERLCGRCVPRGAR